MSTATIDARVRGYAEAVRLHLADLGPDAVDELTDGLEADLAEAVADRSLGLPADGGTSDGAAGGASGGSAAGASGGYSGSASAGSFGGSSAGASAGRSGGAAANPSAGASGTASAGSFGGSSAGPSAGRAANPSAGASGGYSGTAFAGSFGGSSAGASAGRSGGSAAGAAAGADSGADLAAIFGPPARYAGELRAAAGLPDAVVVPRTRGFAALGQGIRRRWERVRARVTASPAGAALGDFLVSLRPFGWVARGWLVAAFLDGWMRSSWSLVPRSGVALFWFLVAVVVSVQWGRGRWQPWRWVRGLAVVATVIAVVGVVPIAGSTARQARWGWDQSWWQHSVPQAGVFIDGEQILNLFPYDAEGRPLENVQLFDERGRPVLLTPEGEPWLTFASDGGDWLHPFGFLSEDGRMRWNVFPLREFAERDVNWSTRGFPEPGGIPEPLPDREPQPIRWPFALSPVVIPVPEPEAEPGTEPGQEEAPADAETPGDEPADEAPAQEEAPGDGAPADGTPVDGEEAPGEESAEEAPGGEAPAQDAPVEEAPAEG